MDKKVLYGNRGKNPQLSGGSRFESWQGRLLEGNLVKIT